MVLRRCVRYAREPGGICVSGKVYEEISGRFDLAFQDMGEQQLKKAGVTSVSPFFFPA